MKELTPKEVLERLKFKFNDEDYVILPKDALLEFITEYLELKAQVELQNAK